MRTLSNWRMIVALALLLPGGWFAFAPVSAQDNGDKTAEDQSDANKEESRGDGMEASPPADDGHDRPTTYPRIRFGSKSDGDGEKKDGARNLKLKTRVYLLDISDAMGKSITIDGTRETTRLEHMIEQIESSLDALARRRDPRLRFNIVTFGTVDDFADGGDPEPVTPASVKQAKEWLGDLQAKGDSKMYGMLKECFEQEPDSATMIVGAKPTWPEDISEEDKGGHEDAGEYLLAEVKSWRADGKKTTLDITGVGLSEDEVKYFKQLAEAAGGTYLDA